MDALFKETFGVSMNDVDPKKSVENNDEIPLAFIHNEGDDLISVEMSKELYEISPLHGIALTREKEMKELKIAPGGNHCTSHSDNHKFHTEYVVEFMEKHLEEQSEEDPNEKSPGGEETPGGEKTPGGEESPSGEDTQVGEETPDKEVLTNDRELLDREIDNETNSIPQTSVIESYALYFIAILLAMLSITKLKKQKAANCNN